MEKGDFHQGVLHLSEAAMAQPILAPASHWEVRVDRQDLQAVEKESASLNARMNGEEGMGFRRRGRGGSKVMMVEEGE